MNAKNRKTKYIISAIAVICSILSGAIACGFTGGTDMGFGMKFCCNAFFMVTPLLVVTAILSWIRKES